VNSGPVAWTYDVMAVAHWRGAGRGLSVSVSNAMTGHFLGEY
jgi:hypothetical protein